MATDAPRWVLVPGTLCSGVVFAPLMQALGVEPARQVVLPQDLPDIAGWRARLAASVRPGDIVCGHSLGAIAVAHCADLIADARALVLIALNPRADAPEKRDGRKALRAAAHGGTLAPLFQAAAPALFARPTPALIDTVTEMAQAGAAQIDAQTALALSRPDALPALRAVRVPMLFVTGAGDIQSPPALAEDAAEVAGNAALRIVPGLGHYCLIENPALVAQTIADGLLDLGVGAC